MPCWKKAGRWNPWGSLCGAAACAFYAPPDRPLPAGWEAGPRRGALQLCYAADPEAPSPVPSHRVQNEALLTECSSTLRQTVTLAVVVLLLLALRLPELFSAPLYGLAEGHALVLNLLLAELLVLSVARLPGLLRQRNRVRQALRQPQHGVLQNAHHGNAGNIHQRAQLGAVIQRGNEPPGKKSHRRHQHLRDAQHHAEQRAAGAVVPHQLHHAGHAQCTGKDSVLCKNSQQCIAEKHCRAAYNFLHGSRSTSFW